MVVVVVFVEGNGAYKNVGLFALEGAKCPISSFLDLFLSQDLCLVLQVGTVFLVYWGKMGEKGLFSSLFSSSNACIFLWSEGNSFIYLFQGLQMADLVVWSFWKVWMPLNVLMVNSTSVVSSGRADQKYPKTNHRMVSIHKPLSVRISMLAFIQFLLKDYCKPM